MVEKENNPPTAATTTSSGEGEEELIDYTNHNAAEVSVLNRLWYKEAVFYEVSITKDCIYTNLIFKPNHIHILSNLYHHHNTIV